MSQSYRRKISSATPDSIPDAKNAALDYSAACLKCLGQDAAVKYHHVKSAAGGS